MRGKNKNLEKTAREAAEKKETPQLYMLKEGWVKQLHTFKFSWRIQIFCQQLAFFPGF